MTRQSKKEIITKLVYDSLPDKSHCQTFTIEQLSFKWFVTGRTGSGLRLTDEGMKIFTEANIAHYDFTVDHSFKGAFIKPDIFTMALNKCIDCPYYLGVKREAQPSVYIRLYDSKVAMMVNLYGNIEDYLTAQKHKL